MVCELLRGHLDEFTEPGLDALVFRSKTGSPLLNRYFQASWVEAKRVAEVDKSVRFHDLRHLAGTTAASAGASLREVMARMGHASSDASLRYLKAASDRDQEIADAIERRLSVSRAP